MEYRHIYKRNLICMVVNSFLFFFVTIDLQKTWSVRTADARFAEFAIANEAGRTTAAPGSRGAIMAINACGQYSERQREDR